MTVSELKSQILALQSARQRARDMEERVTITVALEDARRRLVAEMTR